MVSEDSQNLRWFPVVHRLLDFRDLDDPIDRQVSACVHEFDDPYELLEVLSLRSSQWMLQEERNDLRAEILESVDVVPQQVFAVVISSPIEIDLSATEEPDQFLEDVATRLSLHHIERRAHLPLESHLVATVDGTAEATFSIHKAHYPTFGSESFLRIFRRGSCQTTHRRIVTRHFVTP